MDSTPTSTDPDLLRAMVQAFDQAMARTSGGFAEREAAALKLCNELGRAWLKATPPSASFHRRSHSNTSFVRSFIASVAFQGMRARSQRR